MNSPPGELGEFVDCLKFAELCMKVYTSIFLRKEVPSFHQILKGFRDLKRVLNPLLETFRCLLCRLAFPSLQA